MFLMMLAAATAAPAATPADPKSKVRCVREDVSGSLVQKRKVCKTLREWERVREGASEDADSIITRQGHSPTNG